MVKTALVPTRYRQTDMWRIIGFLLLFGAVVVAIKVAIVLLFLAGLIFRTKETLGLIAVLMVLAGFSAHPAIGFSLVGAICLISLYRSSKT